MFRLSPAVALRPFALAPLFGRVPLLAAAVARGDEKMRVYVDIVQTTDRTWRAACPSLPGCVVVAASIEAVAHEMDCAIRAYLASLEVPPPRSIQQDQNVRYGKLVPARSPLVSEAVGGREQAPACPATSINT